MIGSEWFSKSRTRKDGFVICMNAMIRIIMMNACSSCSSKTWWIVQAHLARDFIDRRLNDALVSVGKNMEKYLVPKPFPLTSPNSPCFSAGHRLSLNIVLDALHSTVFQIEFWWVLMVQPLQSAGWCPNLGPGRQRWGRRLRGSEDLACQGALLRGFCGWSMLKLQTWGPNWITPGRSMKHQFHRYIYMILRVVLPRGSPKYQLDPVGIFGNPYIEVNVVTVVEW